MKKGIDPKMQEKPFRLFGRAPGFAKQPIDVGSCHGEGVIEAKKRVVEDLLQLPLPGHASAFSFESDVLGIWKVLSHIGFIVRVLIGSDGCFCLNERAKFLKELSSMEFPFISSLSVLL